MEYAIQMLIIIVGFAMLAGWLHDHYGLPSIWVGVMILVGAVLGIATIAMRLNNEMKNNDISNNDMSRTHSSSGPTKPEHGKPSNRSKPDGNPDGPTGSA